MKTQLKLGHRISHSSGNDFETSPKFSGKLFDHFSIGEIFPYGNFPLTELVKMGRESIDPPPSPSPSLTNSFNNGSAFFPTTFTTNSRKKWIGLGLTAFLIIVLLIAVIILATTQPEAKTPPCPKYNISLSPNALEGHDEGPKLQESREEGVPAKTKTTTTAGSLFDDFDEGFVDDFEDDDFFVVADAYQPSTTSTTQPQHVFLEIDFEIESNEVVGPEDSNKDLFQPDYFYPEANATDEGLEGVKEPTPEDIAEMLAKVDNETEVADLVARFNK